MATKKLKTGDMAPDFILPDQQKNMVSLKNQSGSWVVLYFYPKDNTPGCTTEALDFTAAADEFKKLNAIVIGISADSCESHLKFMLNHNLGIILLSDKDKEVLNQYGVWRIKKIYGRESAGTVRSTFLIDPSGVIRHIWEEVKVKDHVEEVLEKLKKFSS